MIPEEDLIELKHYQNSEIYADIIDYLDISHPDWKKNKELGSWAAEFVLGFIKLYEDKEEWTDTRDWLSSIYEDIETSYNQTKFDYNLVRSKVLITEFENYLNDNFSEEEITDSIYNSEFEKYKLKDDNREDLTL